MKSIKDLLIVALLCVTLVACTVVLAGTDAKSRAAAAPASQGAPRTITVVGTGEVSLVPDVAEINVGAEARADTVAEAKAEVDGLRSAIVDAVEQMGVDQKDIQTSHYSIYYEREPMVAVREVPAVNGQSAAAGDQSAATGDQSAAAGSQRAAAGSPGGYRVSNMLRVTVRNIEGAGDVLDAAVAVGANQAHGVIFTVSDENRWQGQAREKAMADAKARAAELARLAGAELGNVLSVSEIIGGWPGAFSPVPERSMGGGGIAPGALELGTQVQVTFAIQ